MADIAHISGFIDSDLMKFKFENLDLVTTTTHKSLRGLDLKMIFGKKELMEQINFAVFPMLQGGPHNTSIAALAVQLNEVNSDEFK